LQASLAAVEVCFETPVLKGRKFPSGSGSGKFGTPCERMHRAKASPDAAGEVESLVVVVVAEVVVPTAATPGLDEPPHADISRHRPTNPARPLANGFTLSMIARPDNNPRSRR
jgi:hypothetical protein